MDRKIDAAGLIVAASALLLVIALFLDWYGLGENNRATAWEAFEVLDLVLLGAAVAAVAAAFGRLDSRVLLGAALVAVVVVVSQLVEPPPIGQGEEIEIGAWLALAAAGGLLAGAALVAAQIAVTVDVRGRERRQRVATVDKRGAGASAPESERVPAPPAGPGGDPFAAPAPPAAARRAPGPADTEPDATQPMAGPPDEPAR